MINFRVNTRPVPKARARVTRYGSYTPQKTVDFEKTIGWEFKRSYPNHQMILTAIRITIVACFKVTPSWTKKKKLSALDGSMRHTMKPDIDNLAKAIMDGLNGIAYKDDNQVCELVIKKVYGENDFVEIEIIDVV